MKRKKNYIIYFIICVLMQSFAFAQTSNFSEFVNPIIGTGGHGHTFPGAAVPFGMVQLSPDTRIDGSWDGCSGYHYSDSVIYGFSHTHLSGTGCSDYGDIMIMPMMGKPSFESNVYASTFSHKNEKANAGFYAVKLDDDNIDVELTSTTRVGFHKYKFNNEGNVDFIIDLNHRDKLIEGEIRIVNDTVIELYRRSEAWAKDQLIYARVVFSKPVFMNAVKAEGGKMHWNTYKTKEGMVYNGSTLKMSLSATVKSGEIIYVKVALSPVSVDGAKKNMEAELSHWNFEKVKKDANELWNKELSKIEVTSDDKDKKTIFYTALYHTMIQPNVAMDVDSMYRGRDNKIHKAEGFTYYSVFSLWDTFRAAHPLYTIIDRKRTSDFINTFLAQYEQGGRLPVWELASNETDCMIGYHAVSVIADAMVKEIRGFDYKKAFEASKHSAMLDHFGLDAYKKNGFISMDDEHESVSKTLEYAYDDWCIAQMAEMLNKKEDYNYFMKRSQSWKNVFDKETGFMRPKKNGGWLSPFDPKEVNNNFTEGNSWQYTFFVPQDVSGLIDRMGGPQKFEAKLDELFSTSSQTTGREQADITGLIGQYAHGNEPSHHMAYLYNYVFKNTKTQAKIFQILNEFYQNSPEGLIGNEDCGQMSAWYVLSSLGLYQVQPGSINFNLNAAYFTNAKIHLESGKTFQISYPTLNEKKLYLRSLKLNNKNVYNLFLTYKDIISGGDLEAVTIDNPYDWHCFRIECNPSTITDNNIISVPVIFAKSKIFTDSLLVSISNYGDDQKVFYTLNNNEAQIYLKPFYINQNTKVVAYVKSDQFKLNSNKLEIEKSNEVQASFFKKPNNWTIKINSKYNPQYTAGGDEGLIDGLHGTENWRKGEWQGFQYQDFECVIDLQKEQFVTEFSASFLQDTRAWIILPTKVEFYISHDNKNFELVKTIENTVPPDDYNVMIKVFKDSLKNKKKARYIKVKAYNFGKLPEWHQGFGDAAFIFVDEIDVK